MSEFKRHLVAIKAFIDERDWNPWQRPKDLAISLNLEAAEVLEHFQWKEGNELEHYLIDHKEDLSDELADVAIYLLELADVLGIDLSEAIDEKMKKNALKYPVEKSKGTNKKYTELE